MKIYMLVVAVAAPFLVATPVLAQTQPASVSRGHFETTPGPRGTTRWVNAPMASRAKVAMTKPTYRLIRLPGPRGGTRLVETRTADPMVRQASVANCNCSMMNDASANMPCKMSRRAQPAKAG